MAELDAGKFDMFVLVIKRKT